MFGSARLAATIVAALCAVLMGGFTGAGHAYADPYVPTGTAVAGGADAGRAKPLEPGSYVDALEVGAPSVADAGSVKYYAVTLPIGYTPYFSATLVPPAPLPTDGRLRVSITMSPRDGDGSCTVTDDASDDLNDHRLVPITAVVAPGRTGGAESCLPAGSAVLKVQREGDAAVDEPLDLELTYRSEPPADGSRRPGAATEAKNLRTGLNGDAAQLTSGTSFGTAPALGSGIYGDTLAPGDVRFVKVRLGWGQRLAYSFTAPKKPGISLSDGIGAEIEIANPFRRAVDQPVGATTSDSGLGYSEASIFGSTSVPVRYNNRESDDDEIAAYSAAGDYYLILSAGVPQSGDTALRLPYTLQIRVSGVPEDAPAYRVSVTATKGRPGTSGSASASPLTAGSSAAAGASGDGASAPAIIGMLAAGVVLVAALAVAVFVRRRRPRSP